MREIERLKQVCRDNGICIDCGNHYIHHMDEPYASCSCGTSEWYEYSNPYMQLQLRYEELLIKCENLEEKLRD